MLSIDDQSGFQLVDTAGRAPSGLQRRDQAVFEACARHLPSVGLTPHPDKRFRSQRRLSVIGAEPDGTRGFVSGPRLRTTALVRLTLMQIKLGVRVYKLFTSVDNSWVVLFLFRCPLLSIFDYVFRLYGTCDR